MTQELTAPSILSLFDTTKAQRSSFSDKVMEAVNDGHLDPLKLKVQLKAIEDIITQLSDRQDFREAVNDAAAKYGRGRHEFHNAVFEVKATAGKYNFVGTEDEKQAINKALREGCTLITNDGEALTVQPKPYTPGADTVFVTLK